MQLQVAHGKEFCKAACRIKSAGLAEIGLVWETGEVGSSANKQLGTVRNSDRPVGAVLWALVVASAPKVMSLVGALLVASSLVVTNLNADESQVALCSDKVRKFVEIMDSLLSENPNDVLVFDYPIKKYLSVTGCNVDEVLSISKSSRFFWKLSEQYTEYWVRFESKRYLVSFALKKTTGNVEVPNARIRLPDPK
jgi:hypothetical protein